ncbi:signal peptide peptidase SppA [Nocardiopsis baichengensis]|uniref:signal peptide peptidase SppA n=1 Tax=Nocardiopsis baichengensis TaxID=280240 RepID=UPI000477ECB1|nr:signal peptide peptidase SppA [Nocardiopsis baichengensis]
MADLDELLAPLADLRRRRTAPLVLELDLTEGVTDEPPGPPLAQLLTRRRERLTDVVEGLRRGARDPRVAAVVAKIGGAPAGLAKVQEIRDAVADFRASGKPAIAWSESIGDFGPGTVGYYLAAAFSEIALAPTGTVGLTGLTLNALFLRGAADKAGVRPETAARHEYKTAVNTFTEHDYTPAHREAAEQLLGSLAEQVRTGIAADRGLDPERVAELTARGPLTAGEALEAGLVDRLAYRDQVYAEVLERAGGEGPEPLLRFAARHHRHRTAAEQLSPHPGRGQIALIGVRGQIHSGTSRRSPTGRTTAGAETVSAALRAARRDDAVRAVVLRVDSPGGSHSASDAVRREVRLTCEAGTPVVVSMGDVAASGGYYVALGADRIIAHPGTVTGSIGVFVAKAVASDLLERLGIGHGSVDSAPHAGMFSATRPFSDSEWERVDALLDGVYADFTAKVGQARDMDADRVDRLARGRVWSGAQAHEAGLVDGLGGLATAVRLARSLSGADDAPLRPYPRSTPLDRLRPPESSEERAGEQVRLDAWGPLAELSARVGLPAAGPLVLPGDWEVR